MKFREKILTLSVLGAISLACNNTKPTPKESIMEISEVAPTPDNDFFLPTTTTGDIVRHKYYTLSYSEEHEQAEWVAYELKKSEIIYSNHKRPYFIEDPEVHSGSASWKNYIRSGYDRGHLCPAGDRRFSKEAFNETFYTSNITPQRNDFNAGIWNRLEQKTRYWAKKYDGLYVVTGGVLKDDLKSIGKEHVAVPEYFYKILIDRSNGGYKTIGFLVPHEESENALYTFVVPIDKIEKITGIDFFSKLPDGIENKIEKSSDYKEWSF
ncbi:DNA/RNA non-specific endonuclease [Flavobacterium sp. GCM10027622]|uniref:DNA/RNA non-specific endonuclease n=1 Tax=unclassified Flavobacterium TaxID=196869 RepID=UPI00361470FB